ncbi:MAG: hypothetical protein LBB82_09490, partial [Treponema sp.]|nr:hypothetical protein [Treponema sp.]
MSIKVRYRVHPFRDEYEELYCEAAPLSELYEKLQSPLDISHARFLINDEIITGGFDKIPPEGSTVYINLVAAG